MTPRIESPPTNIASYDPTRNTAGCTWDGEAAARAVAFFPEVLTHVDGPLAGKPFVLSPWQADGVATLYGWKRPDRTRRYREVADFEPRKQGKTFKCAGLSLYELTCMNEAGPQVYSAAFSREQASLVFSPASRMVKASKYLRARLNAIDSTKRITYLKSGGFYRALPAEAANAHGFNASAVFFDELHTQRTRDLYDVLKTSMGARSQPLFYSISTAGWDRHSICWELWNYARRVRDNHGADDPYFLPIIYELPEGADWKDETTWKHCNPNLGISVSMEFLRQEFERAKQSPAYENTFRNLYLNQWVEQAIRWLPMDAWDEGGADLPSLIGEPCWCGLDMSATQDLTAFAMVFRLDDGTFAVLVHFWIPEDTARAKELSDRVPYRQWAEQGFITLTPGKQVDPNFVIAKITKLAETYNIQEISYDRWGALKISNDLQAIGFNLVEFGQGYASMSGPAKELEKLVLARKIRHGGNPVLRWNATNVAIQRDQAENIKPVKDKSTGRIDGIVATIMGLARAMAGMDTGSYYDTNPLEIG